MNVYQTIKLQFSSDVDSWQLFYGEENFTEKHTSNIEFSRNSQGNYYVTTCSFNEIKNCVISVSNSNAKLLVSISEFNGTVTSSQTIYNNQACCIIYRTCATQSIQTSSTYEGVYLYSVSTSNKQNFLHDSSIFSCGQIDIGSSIHRFSYGNISYSQNNITNNKCYYDVGIEIDSSIICNLTRSTFIDNTGKSRVFYIGASGPYNYYQCNIVNNQVSDTCFKIIDSAKIILESCVFKNNNCPNTIDISSSASVTVIQSDFDGQTISATIKSTKNGHYNNLSHISTGLCEAKFTFDTNHNEVILNAGKINYFPTDLINYHDIIGDVQILTKFLISTN